jgi:hypothetical protein
MLSRADRFLCVVWSVCRGTRTAPALALEQLTGQRPATVAPACVFVTYPDTRRHKRATIAFAHRSIVKDVALIV